MNRVDFFYPAEGAHHDDTEKKKVQNSFQYESITDTERTIGGSAGFAEDDGSFRMKPSKRESEFGT